VPRETDTEDHRGGRAHFGDAGLLIGRLRCGAGHEDIALLDNGLPITVL
jgi:hypothetical protein